jgi:uncharacterized membrane protein (DUF106 family)
VTLVNRALTAVLDALMAPLAWMPVMAGLVLVSLVTAVAVLLAFKWTADQQALAAAKQAMQAAIFEMRLFNDDLVLLFRAQGEVVRQSLTYLRLSLAPTLWLIVPMAVLLLHMEFHFGYAGLAAGEAALVKVRLADSGASATATLAAPDGIQVETPAVVLPSQREIAWRIRPRKPGSYELRVRMGGTEIGKSLLVSDAVGRRSPVRPDASLTSQLLNPSEPPVPATTGVSAITVDYPQRDVSVAGWHIGWVGVYLALTLAFAWILKGLFGVTM